MRPSSTLSSALVAALALAPIVARAQTENQTMAPPPQSAAPEQTTPPADKRPRSAVPP